jgi:hypothetical protein
MLENIADLSCQSAVQRRVTYEDLERGFGFHTEAAARSIEKGGSRGGSSRAGGYFSRLVRYLITSARVM